MKDHCEKWDCWSLFPQGLCLFPYFWFSCAKKPKRIQKSNYELHKLVHCIYTFTNNAPFCRTFQEKFLVIHTMAYTVDCFDYELIAMWHSQFAIMCLVMGQTTDYDSNPIISWNQERMTNLSALPLFPGDYHQDQHVKTVFKAALMKKNLIWITY